MFIPYAVYEPEEPKFNIVLVPDTVIVGDPVYTPE
jgi:hypothetical protein